MSRDDLGAELERLPGVLAATFFSDPDGAPRVYLAIGPDADAENLRRAALGFLADRGLGAHPDRIHVATAPRHEATGDALRRFSLYGLDVHRVKGRAECTVRLRTTTRSTEGTATEPDTRPGRARAAARATLHAAEGLDPDLRLGLHGVRTLDLFGEEALTVLLEVTSGRAHVHLPGVALVDRSVEEAAALAVLTALRSWRS